MLNVVAIRGRVSRPAEERVLPTTGVRVLGLDVTVRRRDSERADAVPVVWHDPPAAAPTLDAGDEVVIIGHVARRFFRAGGSTQSRTEVVAHAIVPIRSSKRVGSALAAAAAEITAALPPARRGPK